jgi:Zn-finger nucleic acid-binding protein
MLLAVDDFTESLREIDGAHDELVFSDEQPSKHACPRCSTAMTSCVIERGKLKLVGTFARCATHGIWFPRDAMTAVFARVSRRAHTFFGGRRGGGVMSSGPGMTPAQLPGGSSGMAGAMGSIARAFGSGPATSGLTIANWGANRPRVHTLYVSAHKDKRLGCPSCKETALTYAGDRWPCATCAGLFVETAALEAMVSDVAQRPWDLAESSAPGSSAPGERNCPVCETPMIVEVLEAVTIDRCAAHGVWFDEDELAAALHHAIEGEEPRGVGGWVKKLFHRHGTTE